jgi:hypothetical protein
LRRGQEATVAVGGKSGCEPSVGDYGPIGWTLGGLEQLPHLPPE